MTETTQLDPVTRMLNGSLRIYTSRHERAALRCGMGDGSTICDLIAKEIEAGGRPSKARREMAAVAKRCGDAIWAMREKVRVPGE